MSRDPRQLRVFVLADERVVEVYAWTRPLAAEARYGLTAQIRRASVSAPTNIVEGCARRSTRDYLHFVGIALGSASEARYLITLGRRLWPLSDDGTKLEARYDELVRALQKLVDSLREED